MDVGSVSQKCCRSTEDVFVLGDYGPKHHSNHNIHGHCNLEKNDVPFPGSEEVILVNIIDFLLFLVGQSHSDSEKDD